MKLIEALPPGFDFFHLGRIELQNPNLSREPTPEPPTISLLDPATLVIGFSLQGDLRGALLVAVDSSLDRSMYSEAGNIIASQFATALSRQDVYVKISPPQILLAGRLEKMLRSCVQPIHRRYLHERVPVDVWVLTLEQEMIADA